MSVAVRSRSRTLVAYLLAPLLAAGTTAFLVAIQNLSGDGAAAALNHLYITGYIFPVVAMTLLGGRLCGATTMLYTTPCSVYYLMAPRLSWKFGSPGQWAEVIFEDLAGLVVVFGLDALTRNVALLKQAQQRADREATMNRVSIALRSSSDPDLVKAAAVRALGEALDVDRCYFVLVEEGEDVAGIRHDWRRPNLESIAGDYGVEEFKSSVTEVLHANWSLPNRDSRDPAHSLGGETPHCDHGSAISVPLHDNGRFVAALVVAMAHSPREWRPDEVALVASVAAQVRSAVETARLRQREHNIATALQEALQPNQPHNVAGLELAMHYRAALAEASVGGDFCDVFPLDKGVTCIVVADLSGKGLAAASQIATVRNMLRYAVYRSHDLAISIGDLNDTLIDYNLLPGFATVFVGVFDNSASTLTYISCGHEPGLLRRHSTGQIEEFSATGPAIGVISGAVYTAQVVPLMPSDRVLIYTDGVTEAGSDRSEFLGVPGLVHLFREHLDNDSAQATIDNLVHRINAHAHGHLRDDVCLMLMRVDPGMAGPESTRQRITLRKSQGKTDDTRTSFYREVLLAATGGRLTLCESEELHGMVDGEPIFRHELATYHDVTALRAELLKHLVTSQMNDLRGDDICICVTEAASNAVKHGGHGFAEMWSSGDDISVLISDSGPGISSTDLARATLESGYSTAQSLGMGFTMMMETADSIALSTTETGTKVMLRVGSNTRSSLADKLLAYQPSRSSPPNSP